MPDNTLGNALCTINLDSCRGGKRTITINLDSNFSEKRALQVVKLFHFCLFCLPLALPLMENAPPSIVEHGENLTIMFFVTINHYLALSLSTQIAAWVEIHYHYLSR